MSFKGLETCSALEQYVFKNKKIRRKNPTSEEKYYVKSGTPEQV